VVLNRTDFIFPLKFRPKILIDRLLISLVQTKMATNVNIYLAGVVVAVALANRRRRAANLMRVRVPCLSEEGDHFSRKQAKYCRK